MEALNWDAITAVSEVVGVIIVAASLIFVGLQIRQSAHATQVATVENFTSDLRDFNYLVGANGEFAEILYKGWFQPGTLNSTEQFRHNNIMTGTLQIFRICTTNVRKERSMKNYFPLIKITFERWLLFHASVLIGLSDPIGICRHFEVSWMTKYLLMQMRQSTENT